MFTWPRFRRVCAIHSLVTVEGPRQLAKAAVVSRSVRSLLALAVAAACAVSGMSSALASPAPPTSGHYDHVFVIVEENHGFTDVIGNPAAPNLNALASQYGVATSYFAVSHPSEPNY